MIGDNTFNPVQYNRLANLDTLEDRIIYYIISPNNKTQEALEATHKIWKLLYYDDINALNEPLPEYEQVADLIYNDNITQTNRKIFRSPHFDSAWLMENAILKVYVNDIIPENRYQAIVDIGIDIIAHNKVVNIYAEDDEKTAPIDIVNGVEIRPTMKSRITTLTQAILCVLNGAHVQGVGTLEFSQTMDRFHKAEYSVWNNRNFEGIKLIMGCHMSGVSNN